MFVHIDCNSFFASCEIADNAELSGRPVVVANVNEAGGGIILALNNEAKALGLKRGNPVFQVKRLLEKNKVAVCPADHKKYHAYSHRIMELVQKQGIVLDFVQYSIDEFFGTLPIDNPEEVRKCVKTVKDSIESETGVPVSCGCSVTYTLAKTATYFAKRYPGYDGICVMPRSKIPTALALVPIGDVWGIGRQNSKKMSGLNVETALDFTLCEEKTIRNTFNTAAFNTYMELKGTPSIEFNRSEQQQSIMQSRTFAYMTTSRDELAVSISRFASDCCTKLRAQGSLCSSVCVFITTNRHRQDLPQYSNSASCNLPHPTADTPSIIKASLALLDSIFKPSYNYKQAGVILSRISSEEGSQLDLFTENDDKKRRDLMKLTDEINRRFGDHSIGFGDTAKKPF